MSFQFPNSPTTNQIFTGSNGAQYLWNGVTWNQVSGNPATLTAQARNRIVNGAMQISQELGTSGTSVNGAYAIDQWQLSYGGVTGVGVLPLVPGSTVQRGLAIQFTVAKPSVTASDLGMLVQPIEGTRIADFYWGTASARQAVLRFDIYSPITGTFPVSIRNGAANRSWLGSYTIAAGEINKYVTKTMVIPGDTTGTWPVDTSAGMYLTFSFITGSTYVGAAGWQAGNLIAPAGMTNGAATTGSFILANVGLHLDPASTGTAPPWVMPDEADELTACQRYWARSYAVGRGNGSYNPYFSSVFYFPALMRTSPAMAIIAGARANISAPSISPFTNGDGTCQCGRFDLSALGAGDYYALNDQITLSARM